jgi:hypothetical protein
MVAHYEQLRNEALSLPAGHAPGLALFLRKGMTAWMRAWSSCMPKPVSETASLVGAVPTCSVDIRAQIATILAGMILSRQPEAFRES